MAKKNKWIKEGMEVCHYDNTHQKMFVEKFIKEALKPESPGQEDEVTENGTRVYIRNVKCHWWEPTVPYPTYREGYFHTRELVPWEIRNDYIEVIKYTSR